MTRATKKRTKAKFKPVSFSVGNKRLLKLADFLQKLPAKRFDFSYWVGFGWEGAQNLSCGTTACALGWAATIPSFRRAGLYLAERQVFFRHTKEKLQATEAAEALFGINEYEAKYLFVPTPDGLGSDATSKQVARHIREFVTERSLSQ